MKPTMMMYTSDWHGKETFKLFPVETDCPYVECIFDPDNKILAVFSKEKKESLHMVPRLDDNGNTIPSKSGSKKFREQRITLDTYNEYYITKKDEMVKFINVVAINAEEFDFNKFLVVEPAKPMVTAPTIAQD